jgi:hypothetical protein
LRPAETVTSSDCARRGADSNPCRRRIAQIVLGASLIPRPTSSPWMRR